MKYQGQSFHECCLLLGVDYQYCGSEIETDEDYLYESGYMGGYIPECHDLCDMECMACEIKGIIATYCEEKQRCVSAVNEWMVLG